jgi:hypothetical protein
MIEPTALPPSTEATWDCVETHRHHRDERLGGQVVHIEEVGAQGSTTHGHHDVVDGRSGGLADGPHAFDRPVLGGEAARPGDGLVEDRARGVQRQ